ncbi:MAG: arylsulfatase [Acidobacteria bacterium]|nr:arylsulfatase [Acidobacteriota bacterium]
MRLSRRQFLFTASAASAAKARPNVILIMTDDQGYGDIARHGNPVIHTPHLDALHDRAVRLTNYHVSPTCAPTRSALMTGRYTNITGAWHTIMGRSLLDHREVTMADVFRANGYRTGIFGKWHLGDNFPCRPQDRGFDEVLVHGGGGIWQTPDFFGNDYSGDTYFHNGKPEKFDGYCTDVWFSGARRFITDAKGRGKPFFCYLTPNAPHGPMWAPEGTEERYKNAPGLREPGFYGMIENIDQNVGGLVDFLKSSGLDQDTILIFTTDNGTSSGAQVFNAGMRASKGSPYDGGHRVPFFIHWPGGGLTGGRGIDTLAAHIDVLPTLMELCGVKRAKGPEMHGRSLVPVLRGSVKDWPDRTIITDSQRMEKLVKGRQASVMTQQWRMVNPSLDGNPARWELYDMRQDPGQKTNLFERNQETAARLLGEYDRWWGMVSARGEEYVRIAVGDPRENPSRLTAHDWHGEGVEKVWNQRGIRQGAVANGFWAIDVTRTGKYRFELRRWPAEINLPVNYFLRDSSTNRESAEGVSISAVKARISVGGVDESVAVGNQDTAAVFTLALRKGPAELRTWFTSSDGTERGAYYVYISKL